MIYVCYNLDAFINFKRIFVIFHNHEKQERWRGKGCSGKYGNFGL